LHFLEYYSKIKGGKEMSNNAGVKSSDELFQKLMGQVGMSEEVEGEEGNVVSVDKDDLLLTCLGLTNALLNIIRAKGICNDDELISTVVASVKSTREIFSGSDEEDTEED
jgi:hypothetical protein